MKGYIAAAAHCQKLKYIVGVLITPMMPPMKITEKEVECKPKININLYRTYGNRDVNK